MPVNASAEFVPELAQRARAAFPQTAIHDAILPAQWNTAPLLLDALVTRHQPNLILHFGVARDCTGFRIETRAHNVCRQAEDVAGLMPASAYLVDNEPASHAATLPVRAIVERLTGLGYPAAASDDAGGYLCNAVLYHALRRTAGNHACRAGFIHIPADLSGQESKSALTFEAALSGGLEIVRACLDSDAVNVCYTGAELA